LNILTIGLLSPLVTFKLEKFMVDRTWYGDAKFIQNGRWQKLYGGMKHFLFALLFMAAFIGLGYLVESAGLATIGLVVGYIWFILASVYYNIYALNYMAGEKLLDHKVSFLAVVRTGKILGIMIIGMLAIFGLLFVVGLFGSMLFAGFFSGLAAGDVTGAGVGPVMGILGIVLYVGMILLIGGLSLVLITQPIIRHVVESLTVTNADHLDTIRQRAADAGADAEGFADALDIGAAL
jgi:hypothetical protein